MSRHTFRWEGLAFGLFFLAGVGSWAVWKQDLLTPRQLSLTVAGGLILLGAIGVAATIWHARPNPVTAPTTTEGATHEDLDPQS